MSLVVWLPLTRDLRQQGLNSTTIEEVTSAVFDNSGKLGKCLSGGKIKIPASQVASIFNNTSMSIAFWYNNNTSETTGNHAICGFSGNGEGDTDAVRIWDFFNYSNPNTFHWSMGTLGGGSLSNIFPANTWVHVCVTWSAPTLKIYMDGVLKYTGSGSSNYTFDKSYYISFGRTPQKLNDFRIYDHCLSPMEVKELAKGLVLHYPLNRQGWGQNNLIITNSMAPTSGTSGWSSAGTGWANSNVISSEASNGHAIRCTYSGTTQVSGGIHHPTGVDKTTLTTGAIYTLTARIRASKACVATFHNELMTTSNTINLTTDWKIYSYSCKIDNTRSYHSNVIYVRAADAVQNMWIECDWIKLEEGAKSTPWVPNSAETLYTTMGLNSTTEYDCSGFCNNGTRTGTFSWTSDTPKYQVSTKFSQSRIQCNGDFLYGLSTATLSAWVKLTAYHSERCMVIYANGRYLTINNSGQLSGYSYGKTPAGYYNSNQTIPLNTWTHITIVWDDTTWYFYINGTLVNSWACTGTFTNVGSYASVGQESNGGRSVSGLISDARIYATALSADDVKSLYQNSAYIDSSGNVYGAVHTEV